MLRRVIALVEFVGCASELRENIQLVKHITDLITYTDMSLPVAMRSCGFWFQTLSSLKDVAPLLLPN